MMAAAAPSWMDLAMEPLRGGMSLLKGMATLCFTPAGQHVRGTGQPVMVLPGLGTNEHSTALMRKFLNNIGYDARDWGMGLNAGPRGGIEPCLDQLEQQLIAISYIGKQQKVVLLGWSLGGVFARELAKRRPDLVEMVISMGTPLTGDPDATNVKKLYEMISGADAAADQALLDRIKEPPPVPCVSIFSKTDGIVAWEACAGDKDGVTKGVEIEGVSHLGMMTHPIALKAVAQELANHFA